MGHHSEPVSNPQRNDSGGGRSIPAWVDWLIGGAIALVGLVLAGVGTVLTTVVNREMITDVVADFGTQSTFFTQAETIDIAVPTVTWTGIGLLVSGFVLVAGAAAYVYYQRKLAQAAGTNERVGNLKANAVAGGAAALVLSFIPFSQVLGGTVAGYLEHGVSGKSTRVGAVSGVLGVIPGLLVIPFVIVGVALGAAAIGEQSITFLIGGVALGGLLFSAAIAAGFGALGGYASRLVADDGL